MGNTSERLRARLARLRGVAGLSRTELSRELDVAEPTVSRWESGARGIDWDDAERIARYFGLPFIVLVNEDPEPFSEFLKQMAMRQEAMPGKTERQLVTA